MPQQADDTRDEPVTPTTTTTANDDDHHFEKRTPLPKLQIAILFLLQFTEPLTATVIYPFINRLVRWTGITNGDERKVGYYAGFLESVFFLTESLVVIQWGFLADRYGRKPLFLIGPFGLSIVMIMFGLSTTFWPLLGWRALQGVFNGNIGVSKTILAEITDHTNLADAYAISPIMWNTGFTLGPIIGGLLAEPAQRWPDTFGQIRFFINHPYFLPCAITAVITFAAFGIGILGLKETLPSLVAKGKAQQKSGLADDEGPLLERVDGSDYGATDSVDNARSSRSSTLNGEDTEIPTVSAKALASGPILYPLLCYGALCFLDMCNAALRPVVFATSIPLGGLGMSPATIGKIMSTFGIANCIIQVAVMGPLMRRYGPRKVFIVSMFFLVATFPLYPLMNSWARRANGIDAIVWIGIVLQFSVVTVVSLAYVCASVMIIQLVPQGGPIGTINGIAQMCATMARSLAPTLATSLFSFSLTSNILGGTLVYWVLTATTIVFVRLSFCLPTIPKRRQSLTRQNSTA